MSRVTCQEWYVKSYMLRVTCRKRCVKRDMMRVTCWWWQVDSDICQEWHFVVTCWKGRVNSDILRVICQELHFKNVKSRATILAKPIKCYNFRLKAKSWMINVWSKVATQGRNVKRVKLGPIKNYKIRFSNSSRLPNTC